MKITKSYLKQLIREALEGEFDEDDVVALSDPKRDELESKCKQAKQAYDNLKKKAGPRPSFSDHWDLQDLRNKLADADMKLQSYDAEMQRVPNIYDKVKSKVKDIQMNYKARIERDPDYDINGEYLGLIRSLKQQKYDLEDQIESGEIPNNMTQYIKKRDLQYAINHAEAAFERHERAGKISPMGKYTLNKAGY